MVTTRWARGTARSSSWEANTTVAPAATASPSEGVEQVAAGGVEAGVGLVEQPQLRAAGGHDGERRAAALAGRQPVDGHGGQPPGHAEAVHGGGDLGVGGARRCGPRSARSRRRSGRRRGRCRGRAARPWCARPGARSRRSQPRTTASPAATGTRPARTRSRVVLPAPLRPADQDDLAALDVEVGAGQRREPPEKCHRTSKVNDRLHETVSPYLRGSG